ncbi:MAG: ATP-dependent Clp protease ATP-binding subunit [Candidatus Pacebacteria bacterium]|nr:ATP-dependent Clp protease ATP-binding subunit [Candidatus Paceibacterota bacterium]
MSFQELQQIIQKLYGPALVLRRVLPREKRGRMVRTLMFLVLLFFVLVVVTYGIQKTPLITTLPFLTFFGSIADRMLGAFLLIFSMAFVLHVLEAFHRSYYFHGLTQILSESPTPSSAGVGWEVGTIVVDTPADDVTLGFLESSYGQEALFRAGVTMDAFEQFFSERVHHMPVATFVLDSGTQITLATYVKSLYTQDHELKQFLARHKIGVEDVVQAAEWVSSIEQKERQLARWWSRDSLGRIPGLGKTWSYGETYLLERHGHDLVEDQAWHSSVFSGRVEDDEVEEMEHILARARQSNVLLIGEDLMSVRQSVIQLYRKIRAGTILPPLEGRRIFFIDFEGIAMHAAEKNVYEAEVVRLMNQAVGAGNTILYFERLLPSILSAKTIGVDLVEILAPYFESDTIQIIAAGDKQSYHAHLSRDNRIVQAFDMVAMHSVSERALISILEQRAFIREGTTGVVFSVPALRAVARLADRYFPGGVMPDKAFDLLEELVPMALTQGTTQVLSDDVEKLVHQKTGVPMGDPSAEEREKLLSLENFLHQRVVGQEVAVNAVSRALRRARAGVGSAKRPMGSFLFLGPTGVGKTETAKALAEALFGNERMMSRLDMSEFQGSNALEELIGSFEMGTPGRLATLIRDHQYGVLLLDEFEKSSHDVHDLFLQVLDEGEFTDATGKSVNARNLIIIATSNAGADLIWQWEKEGKDVVAQKRVLIDHIIGTGLYRPEFLNRFDDIIVFHPLKEDHIRSIARIHLTNLAKRLAEERNIELEVTDELVDRIAKKGYDPQFGGRPLIRAIKDEVEQMVADSILGDTLHPGDTIAYHEK